MKFYKVEMVGELILEKIDSLPEFDSDRDEGRLVYNLEEQEVYIGDESKWKLLSGIQRAETLPEFDSTEDIGKVYYIEDQDGLFYGSSERDDWAALFGGLAWLIIDSDTNADPSYGYFCKTSEDEITITLPSDPKLSDMVGVKDIDSNASDNNITIDGNGNTIEGEDSYVIDIDKNGFQLVFVNSDIGWIKTSEVYGYAVYA